MKKIFLATAIAFAALSLQSCLHDDEELFPDSAANRLEAAVKADRELLESAENGWEMHYYTGEQYTGGGYTMFMKFKNGKAFVSSDIAPADMVETSSYDIVKDKGPVLTFNTYNMVMHYLAQPFQDDVDGEQGDYEFVITKTTQDSIYVKGKKWGNKFVMTRIPASTSWKETITKMQTVLHSMRFFYLTNGVQDVSTALTFDPTLRRAYLGSDDTSGVPFYLTTEGIELHTPITINGKQVQSLKFEASDKSLSCADAGYTFTPYTPAGFTPLESFVGNWTLGFQTMSNGSLRNSSITMPIQQTQDLIQQTSFTTAVAYVTYGQLLLRFIFSYSPIAGTLTLPTQYVLAADDGSGQYAELSDYVPGCAALMMLGVNSSGLLNGTDSHIYYPTMTTVYDSATKKYSLVDANGQADGLAFICVDSSGSPMYQLSDGSFTTDTDKVEADEGASLASFMFWFNVHDFTPATE